VLATGLAAESDDKAIDAVRVDLEVLDRDDLLRVATALATCPSRFWFGEPFRAKLTQRMERVRLEIVWESS
jgi:hypothetical protein